MSAQLSIQNHLRASRSINLLIVLKGTMQMLSYFCRKCACEIDQVFIEHINIIKKYAHHLIHCDGFTENQNIIFLKCGGIRKL